MVNMGISWSNSNNKCSLFVEMVKNIPVYVVFKSLFIIICSSLNQIGSCPSKMRTVGVWWVTVYREF